MAAATSYPTKHRGTDLDIDPIVRRCMHYDGTFYSSRAVLPPRPINTYPSSAPADDNGDDNGDDNADDNLAPAAPAEPVVEQTRRGASGCVLLGVKFAPASVITQSTGLPPGDRSFDRNEQHRAALEHHPTNAACPCRAVRSGICLHLLIAGFTSVAPATAVAPGHQDPNQDQAVSRPSNVKSCRDATGHNEAKPAGRVGPAIQMARIGRLGQRTDGLMVEDRFLHLYRRSQ